MSRARRSEAGTAEQLILQDAWLRSTATCPREEFKQLLRARLAYGAYGDPDDCADSPEAGQGGPCSVWHRLVRAFSSHLRHPAWRFTGMAGMYLIPVLFVLLVSPTLGRGTSLSAIAAEMRTTLSSRGAVYYEVKDSYTSRYTSATMSMLWRVWTATGGYAYVECHTSDGRDLRFYARPEGDVLIDDTAHTVRVTTYHGRIDEGERRAEMDLVAPLGIGGDLPALANLAGRAVSLQYDGKETMGDRICKAYSSGKGLRVWVDAAESGYLRAEDTSGATSDPQLTHGNPSAWDHSLEVSAVQRDSVIPDAVFAARVPDGYRVTESREVYETLGMAGTDLCFRVTLPAALWKTFERPRGYVVVSGSDDALLEVTLFRRGQTQDPASALRLTAFRPALLESPVNGRTTDPDAPFREVRADLRSGARYEWISAGIHFGLSTKARGEHTEPDANLVGKEIADTAEFLPRF